MKLAEEKVQGTAVRNIYGGAKYSVARQPKKEPSCPLGEQAT